MNKTKNDLLWAVSLIVVGAATLLIIGLRMAAVPLPDMAVRGLGLVELAALPVLAYTTVRRLRGRAGK